MPISPPGGGPSIYVAQIPSGAAIELKITVTNSNRDRAFWINRTPGVGDNSGPPPREDEIEIQLVDARLRRVGSSCAEARGAPGRINFELLPPKQSFETIYVIDPQCHLLIPGETLWMRASYLTTNSGPEAPPGALVLEKPVATGGWQQIVVPRDWVGQRRPPLRPRADTGAVPTNTSDVVERPSTGILLRVEQVPEPSAVVIKLTLVNPTSNRHFWINSKPHITHSSDRHRAEVAVTLKDSNLRPVRSFCADHAEGASAGFQILESGQNVEFGYSLDPRCYILSAGETLQVAATYNRLESWPAPMSGGEQFDKPAWTGWQEIVVPAGWQEVASPGKFVMP